MIPLTPGAGIAAARAEAWRRSLHGMRPRAQLQQLDLDALRELAGESSPSPELQPAAWFGPMDDRRDPLAGGPLPGAIRERARRTCYLIGAAAVATRRDGQVKLHSAGYGEYHNLCRDERFWSQPCVIERDGEALGGYGYTGLLIAPDLVLTCWHGWEAFSYRPHLALFDYALHADSRGPEWLSAEAVVEVAPYPERRPGGAAMTPAADDDASRDWVVLRLARPVRHLGTLAPLPLGTAASGDAVYTLGYPCGLPLKLADGAEVLTAGPRGFRANLDTFTGNSGSPVFDARTHALVGMVVEAQKGEGDFEPSPARGCYVTNRVDSHITGQLAVPASCLDLAPGGLT